jgi:uncharacterized RDD family membrane protein YckC
MSPIDDLLMVDTPENVSFGFEIAGIGSRFLAALVDTLLILLLQALAILMVLAAVLLLNQNSDLARSFLQEHIPWVLAAAGLISFFFLWGYYIFFEMSWNGQSPGKRLAKLRVIRTDGRPITLPESLVRNLVRLVDFLPAYYGVGVVAMFIHPQSRRLGDLAAGTLVVHEKAQTVSLESLEVAHTAALPPNDPSQMDLDLPLERLTSQDLQMVEDFLQRQGQLANAEQLGTLLLQRWWQKMGLPPESLPKDSTVSILTAIYKGK